MTSLVESYAYWLADYYLLATLLLGGTMLALALVRQPARKLAITKSSLVALVLLASLSALPGWSFVHLFSSEAPANDARPAPARPLAADDDGTHTEPAAPTGEFTPAAPRDPLPAGVIDAAAGPAVSWPEVFVFVHLLGAACVATWLAAGLLAARRLRRTSQPAPVELIALLIEVTDPRSRVSPRLEAGRLGETALREVELLISDRIEVAVALGIWSPAVLLPTKWISKTPLPDREGLGEGSPHD